MLTLSTVTKSEVSLAARSAGPIHHPLTRVQLLLHVNATNITNPTILRISGKLELFLEITMHIFPAVGEVLRLFPWTYSKVAHNTCSRDCFVVSPLDFPTLALLASLFSYPSDPSQHRISILCNHHVQPIPRRYSRRPQKGRERNRRTSPFRRHWKSCQ